MRGAKRRSSTSGSPTSSAFGLAQRVGISRNEAKKVIDEYYRTYAGVKKYMDELPDRARKRLRGSLNLRTQTICARP